MTEKKSTETKEKRNNGENNGRTVKISVRSLVEFLLRKGDLEKGRGGIADKEAMQAGSRVHRKIQGGRGTGYRAEVPLKESFPDPYSSEEDSSCPPFTLQIEGRADGIEEKEGRTAIEEIKGVFLDVNEMEEPSAVHLAQAKCYAAIYGKQRKLKTIFVRMTYANLENGDTRAFHFTYETDSLRQWFENLAYSYMKWAKLIVLHEGKRNRSVGCLKFPFPYREGQKKMTAAVWQAILKEKQIFVQAPTGTGKTMSSLFPAVQGVGRGMAEKIFYLTSRTIGRTVAEEAFSILRKQGLEFYSLTITAREKICVCDEVNCSPEYCPRAAGHFDRINDALYDILTGDGRFDREEVQKAAEKWNVCPYELQLDLTDFMDGVICDYNYVFDPNAKLGRYFGDSARKGACILLADEAHDLVDRGRDMFSAELHKEEILRIRRMLSKKPGAGTKKITAALSACNQAMRTLKKQCETDADAVRVYEERCLECRDAGNLAAPLMNLDAALEDYLTDAGRGRIPSGEEDVLTELQQFFFGVRTFVNCFLEMDPDVMILSKIAPDGGFSVKISCMNPASRLQASLDKCRSVVFFSATLLPIRYYDRLLTTKEDSYRIYLPSPFCPSHRLIAVGRDVSSRFKRRGPKEYGRMVRYIDAVLSGRKGNYIVFFPSYRMMEDVLDVFLECHGLEEDDPEDDIGEDGYLGFESPGLRLIVQTAGMREKNRESFLREFSEESRRTLAAFCVMGGIFAEGIDLTGERLIGAIVVGTGLPQVSAERELVKQYYDRTGENGFDFAYRYPGMNKVLQASGRVIRTETDRGIILLLDERFLQKEYLALLPREWSDLKVTDSDHIAGLIGDFWAQDPPQDGNGSCI